MMSDTYKPKEYWEKRLSNSFSLRSVGHIGFSDAYNAWLYRRKKACLEACMREVALPRKTVLDIGCGTGFFVEWYIAKGAVVSGIDITHASIDRLRMRFKGDFSVQDIGDLGFAPPGAFDIVNMWDVIYHIVAEDSFEQTFRNIARAAKPGALLLLTDWFGAPADLRVGDHVQARSMATYANLLPRLGFHLIRVVPLYRFLNKRHFPLLDNHLGWLYFLLDRRLARIVTDNLALALWRYTPNADLAP